MTDTRTLLQRAKDTSQRVKDSNEKLLHLTDAVPEEQVRQAIQAIEHTAILNGVFLQQAALDVAIENVEVQKKLAAATAAQVAALERQAEALEIIAGQNPGGYRWTPMLSVEIANPADLR